MASGITLAGAVWTDLGTPKSEVLGRMNQAEPGNWGIKTHELYTSHTSKVIDIWKMHSN